jgi:hypothetical protein
MRGENIQAVGRSKKSEGERKKREKGEGEGEEGKCIPDPNCSFLVLFCSPS